MLAERQKDQARRITTIEDALRASSAQTLRTEENTNGQLTALREELGDVKTDVASVKTTLKVVGAVVGIFVPFLTVVLARVLG